MTKLILLDNGHGIDTAGKRSPVWSDGTQLFEYEFNRDVVKRISKKLIRLNIGHIIVVPELTDIPLAERCRRVNVYHKQSNNTSVLFSIHANAGQGTGWECWTSIGKTKADDYALIMLKEATDAFYPDWRIRGMKEGNFYLLTNTVPPAILTENFFMDAEKDCRFIMSAEGRNRIAEAHVQAILKIQQV